MSIQRRMLPPDLGTTTIGLTHGVGPCAGSIMSSSMSSLIFFYNFDLMLNGVLLFAISQRFQLYMEASGSMKKQRSNESPCCFISREKKHSKFTTHFHYCPQSKSSTSYSKNLRTIVIQIRISHLNDTNSSCMFKKQLKASISM